jgi:hypothetical protein
MDLRQGTLRITGEQEEVDLAGPDVVSGQS